MNSIPAYIEGGIKLVLQSRDKTSNRRPPVEQNPVEKDLAVIRSKMNDTEFEKLSAEGRTMTVEQAIALALET